MAQSPRKSQTPAERRSGFRCAVSGPRQHGRLRIGVVEIAVVVLDESVGGFAVEAAGEVECQLGDTLLLHIASDWYEVRLVNITPWELTDEETDATIANLVERRTRLGMLRIRELLPSEVAQLEAPAFTLRRIRKMAIPFKSLGRSWLRPGAIALGMILTGAALVWILEQLVPVAEEFQRHAKRASKDGAGFQAPVLDPPKDPLPDHQPEIFATPPERKTAKRQRPSRPTKQVNAAAAAAVAKATSRVPQEMIRLADPAFLLRPEVANVLSLSDGQRELLKQLAAESAEWSGVANGAPQLLGQRGLAILTEDQKQSLSRIQSLLDSTPREEGPGPPTPPNDAAPDESAPPGAGPTASGGSENRGAATPSP